MFDKDQALLLFNSPQNKQSFNPLFLETRYFNNTTQDYQDLKDQILKHQKEEEIKKRNIYNQSMQSTKSKINHLLDTSNFDSIRQSSKFKKKEFPNIFKNSE